ncbi:hypothetical protein [Sulfitobacter sp. CW3]|jgi:hypothetical protein|uniref:hypothetical protein n=1 Tax=Sulfitobacter sp. CW3 TaxID=2861965 RepID=UPI001C5DA9EE|nr:hypothetical protein [Sulfitobacter sp. CW3]MBW4961048.1 hypothetical protein [Sulfitobacter sp. CW3]
MTRTLTRSDLEEIEDFYAEFGDTEGSINDPLADDVTIDTLISQLEASFETVSALTRPSNTAPDDLRLHVRDLAERLEKIAVELAQVNQALQLKGNDHA